MSGSRVSQTNGQPILELVKQHNSHHFENRSIVVNEEIKVGRAVARLRSSKNNAIFDCKVLSRSHAIIWYSDEKFWLRDTNSSNGTFVNNIKIVDGENELAEREIFSGDFIKFGVEVVEHETTHGCIIAQVKLYHPSGQEAYPPGYSVQQAPAHDQSLYCNREHVFQLTCHINEALFREGNIEKKLEDLQHLLLETKDVSQTSWKAMLNEDRLLEKLELYERQLKMLKENLPEDCLKTQMNQILEEKTELERESKNKVEKILDEKQAALKTSIILEKNLEDSERELKRLKSDVKSSEKALEMITTSYSEKARELQQLESFLCEANSDKSVLSSKLFAAMAEIKSLEKQMETNELVVSSNQNIMNLEAQKDGQKLQERLEYMQNEAIRLRGLVDQNEQLRSSLCKKAETVCDEVALSELEGLDKFIDMQDTNERNLENVIDRVSANVGSNLIQGAKQFSESIKLIKLLQEQLLEMERTKALYEKSLRLSKENIPEESNSLSDALSNKVEDEEQHVSSTDDNVKVADFNMSIIKAKELTQKLAASHVIAENNFVQYFHECESAPDIISSKSDWLNSIPPKDVEISKQPFPINEFFESLYGKSNNDSVVSSNCLENEDRFETEGIKPKSTLQSEIAILQQQLDETTKELNTVKGVLASNNEGHNYTKVVEDGALPTMKSGDSIASITDLKSLRVEHDALREKMACIDKELAVCKKDHERLVDESKKSLIEMNSLKSERDNFQQRLEESNREKDQLLERLTGVLSERPEGMNESLNSSSTSINDSSMSRTLSTVSTYIVIPVMVVLLAIMMSIYNYF